MKKYFFSDLAIEKRPQSDSPVVFISKSCSLHRNFLPEILSKKEGNEARVITFFTPKIWEIDGVEFKKISEAVGDELSSLIRSILPREASAKISVLVIGLGNRELTSDALGPQTVQLLTVTASGSRVRVSAIAPGVYGQTGIESVDHVKGILDRIRADVVVAIDSLRAANTDRLGATVQISDGGISPGSGIGNHRKSLDRQQLGVPVIAIGVPTVICSATLVADMISRCGIRKADSVLRKGLEENLCCYVSPKESDLLLKSASLLLATALDRACMLLGEGRTSGI